MKALTWHGRRDVRVDNVPDPSLREPTDIIIEVTSSGLCGSDLHLYEVLGPYLRSGDILGHEPIGRVVEKGAAVKNLELDDRVVIPFQIACGHCFMCERGLQTQCETTQTTEHGMGAALFGYTELYGAVPGAQAEFLRVPHADYGPIKIERDLSDDRYVLAADVAPTAYQAVEYSGIESGQTLAVVGLGPIGEMAARIALHRDVRVIGLDVVSDRLIRPAVRGVEAVDLHGDRPLETIRDLTEGRGVDAVIDAVGMEAHGSPVTEALHKVTGVLPDRLARPLMDRASTDRLHALNTSIEIVRRGGTVSLSGVYAGIADVVPMQTMFDKQLTLRMGQANVRRWSDDVIALIEDSADPLGLQDFVTHRLPLAEAPSAYQRFQDKHEGMYKVIFEP